MQRQGLTPGGTFQELAGQTTFIALTCSVLEPELPLIGADLQPLAGPELGNLAGARTPQDGQGLTRCPRKMFPLPRAPAVYPSPLHFKKFAGRSPLPSQGRRRPPRNSCTSFCPGLFPPSPPPALEHASPQAVDVPCIDFLAPGGVGWGGVCASPFVSPNAKTVVTFDTTLTSCFLTRRTHSHIFWKEYSESSSGPHRT